VAVDVCRLHHSAICHLCFDVRHSKAKEGSKILPAKAVLETLKEARPIKTVVQSNLLTDLQKELRLEQQSALLAVSVDQRGIVIALDDRTCFRPGQSRVELPPLFRCSTK
jgi:hypothetical protein